MSTKLFNAKALVAGTTIVSDAITDVGDLVIDVDFASLVIRPHQQIEFIIQVHEGSNAYKPIGIPENNKVSRVDIYKRLADSGFRDVIRGIDTENLKVYVKVPAGTTGTMTLEYNKTANNIPSA